MAAELEKITRRLARNSYLMGAGDLKEFTEAHLQEGTIPESLINGDSLMPNETLGHWLKRSCQARGWSQRKLATFAGVDHSSVSRLFSGKRLPTIQVFSRIIDTLDLDPDLVYDAITRFSKQETKR